MEVPELRPLSLGELLDRTFTYYRRHFWLFVGIMAIPQVLLVAVNVISQALQGTAVRSAGPAAPVMPQLSVIVGFVVGAIVLLAAYFVLYTLALGATTFAVSEVHLGRATTARAAYRSLRGRVWRIVDLIVTVTIRMVLVLVLMMALPMLFALYPGAAGGIAMALVFGLVMLILYVGGAIYAVRMLLSYACAVPALLLENLKAKAAIKRSVALTRKNLGRVFLIGLLMTLIAWTAAALLQGPFFVAIFVFAARANAPPPIGLTIGMNIAGGVGQALTGPLLMIGLVLLYYDIRVRKEGFDLQLMLSAVDAQSPQSVAVPPAQTSTDAEFERTNVALIVVLTFISFGLYYPIWFLRRRSALNGLRSPEKLGAASLVVALGLTLAYIITNLAVGFTEGLTSETTPYWLPVFDGVAMLSIGVILIFQAFKVRRILEDHMSKSRTGPFSSSIALLHDSSISGVATFFFGIFYLQYEINQMADAWVSPIPNLGVEPAPPVSALPPA